LTFIESSSLYTQRQSWNAISSGLTTFARGISGGRREGGTVVMTDKEEEESVTDGVAAGQSRPNERPNSKEEIPTMWRRSRPEEMELPVGSLVYPE